MALRNQPYIPLYVDDFQTDEKLIECSAESTGVYTRIMCLMHKSEQYGSILLKQKYKQTDNQTKNFAVQLAKFFPYPVDVIERSLKELIQEKVLQMEGDILFQKRMVRDSEISLKRSEAGGKGGDKTASLFAKAKDQANTVIGNENENINEIIDYLNNKAATKFKNSTDKTRRLISTRLKENFSLADFKKVIDIKCSKWKDDPKMKDYLRPETLFGTKFESYLNEKGTTKTVRTDEQTNEHGYVKP